MAHNKLYRNFIILQEDERGYSHANDKALSGYAKIEAKGDKCKVSFYAQNLRQEDNYSMVLICSKRDLKQLIDIGPLAINEVGKGDTSKEYYVNNIAGLGISYEKVSGAAICRMKDNENEFIMHGFMNGEDSADNWRKFKFVKADSKKYINKLDLQPIKKDIVNSDMTNKTTVSQSSDVKASILQSELAERKKDENILHHKENIELGKLNDNSSKAEDIKNRMPENHANIAETKDFYDNDRKKCGEFKKEEKHEKCAKCDKLDEHDYYEKNENIEEIINKLGKKLDAYDGIADIKINHAIHADVIVYGFIKDKNNYNCKWKKFKLEKKCRTEGQEFNDIQNSKRLEENFKLDKLNEIDNSDRLDMIDFDKYENDLQQSIKKKTLAVNKEETMGTGAGTMVQPSVQNMETGTGAMKQPETETMETGTGTMKQPEMGKVSIGTTCQPGMGNMGNPWASYGINQTETGMEGMVQSGLNVCGKLDLSDGEPANLKNMQQEAPNQFKINGNIGQYFEKIAESFAPYFGKLNDINYCKWYKINVNSIEDLSDESNYNKYTLAYYPMLNYYPYISKIGHFLLGYKCDRNGDMQHIIYAIPGSKEKNDQPYGGRTGFVTWTSDNKNGRGYWLMFYDFKNSSIVIPTR